MEDKQLQKVAMLMQAAGATMLGVHFYWYCHSVFMHYGLSFEPINFIMLRLNEGTALFSHLAVSKVLSVVFLVLACFGTKGRKDEKFNSAMVISSIFFGLALLFGNFWLLEIPGLVFSLIYIATCVVGYLLLLYGLIIATRLMKNNLMKDVFNIQNESFMQETRLMENERSINLQTEFYYEKKWNKGWINIINPFRATMVLGTPGSGKSFAVINPYIKQTIEKGFALYVYDFKYPTLTEIAYNHYRLNQNGYKVKPTFYILNFDKLEESHRCNPIHPDFMHETMDAYESASVILLNLNKTWVEKQGDFFVESAISLLASVIWFLKIYQNGKYCTFPHVIEFVCSSYEKFFPILESYPELENSLAPFMDAWKGGAQDQLQGQTASVRIPLGRIISPSLYWILSGNDFTLDLNNPDDPKILCVGNNPDRQIIYSAALGLFNARIIKVINKDEKLKSAVIIDELPTIYFKGLDSLIATARSRKVAVCLGCQDYSQLERDYGKKEADVIKNIIGNTVSGQVKSATAKTLSEGFGKNLQQRQSISINKSDVSTSISTQMDNLIPASVISNLSQGKFVGSITDDFGQEVEQKVFHCKIKVDIPKLKAEEKQYKKIPIVTDFNDFRTPEDSDLEITEQDSKKTIEEKNEALKERVISRNYRKIRQEVAEIIEWELDRLREEGRI